MLKQSEHECVRVQHDKKCRHSELDSESANKSWKIIFTLQPLKQVQGDKAFRHCERRPEAVRSNPYRQQKERLAKMDCFVALLLAMTAAKKNERTFKFSMTKSASFRPTLFSHKA
ncbi:MAG: hypothetical protein SOT81_11000 [Treponema sp.]|nr:hypothetical protein [Treponema sp.]